MYPSGEITHETYSRLTLFDTLAFVAHQVAYPHLDVLWANRKSQYPELAFDLLPEGLVVLFLRLLAYTHVLLFRTFRFKGQRHVLQLLFIPIVFFIIRNAQLVF
jgi:hypothetical protein